MWEFLKKIFTDQDQEHIVKLFSDEETESTQSFRIKKADTILLLTIFFLVSMLFSTLLFFVTPLGNIFETKFDTTFRKEVLEITQRVEALQDSLTARDLQLNDLKNFVRTVPDTTFEVDERVALTRRGVDMPSGLPVGGLQAHDMYNRFQIVNHSNRTENPFPAFMPAEGNITQGFSDQTGHYGIDIALTSGTPFLAVADGVVFHAGWTMNYGYILLLQHENGVVSIYKHAEKLSKRQGDFVVKGDVLGTVGDRGIMSSGSHLHFEIWEQGIPRNPLIYLENYQPAGY